jgi:hypothetical protein
MSFTLGRNIPLVVLLHLSRSLVLKTDFYSFVHTAFVYLLMSRNKEEDTLGSPLTRG